jgi:hypothetical protein
LLPEPDTTAFPRTAADPHTEGTMNRTAATQRHAEKPRKPAPTQAETTRLETAEHQLSTYMEEHEWPRLTAGVAAAAGAGLLIASVIGVGPAAIAGAAGYLAYRELHGKRASAGASRRAQR